MNLLKSYLNSQIKTKKVVKRRRGKPIKKNYRYKSTKNIFVGKGDLKHSNDKVIITFFMYNAEKMYIKFLFKKWKKILFYPNKPYKINITKLKVPSKKIIIARNRRHNMYEILYSPITKKSYIKFLNLSLKRFNKFINKLNKKLNFINKLNLVLRGEDKLKLLQYISQFKPISYPNFYTYLSTMPDRYILAKLNLYIILLNYNKLKHKYYNLCKFIPFIENIYRKKVVFNIVNLKKRHLNSDIYTQIVSLKLKNRNNKLYKVLRLSLRGLRVPTIKRIRKIYQKPRSPYSFLIRTLQNRLIKPYLNNFTSNFDKLLEKVFSKYKKSFYIKKRRSYSQKNSIIASIKHRKLRGIRVEAKGRLTRRRTAARSVFKMRYIGGLNNILSHIKGLPAIMLRGDQLSNVQYSIVNTNGRNGAFGIKGWVSSKTRRIYKIKYKGLVRKTRLIQKKKF